MVHITLNKKIERNPKARGNLKVQICLLSFSWKVYKTVKFILFIIIIVTNVTINVIINIH